MGPTAQVYILTDGQDKPLYIGCTNNAKRRIRQHLSARPLKADNRQISKAYVAFAGCLQNALECEAWLIRNNKPAWNTIIPAIHYRSTDIADYLKKLTWEIWDLKEA